MGKTKPRQDFINPAFQNLGGVGQKQQMMQVVDPTYHISLENNVNIFSI